MLGSDTWNERKVAAVKRLSLTNASLQMPPVTIERLPKVFTQSYSVVQGEEGMRQLVLGVLFPFDANQPP